MVMRKMEKAMRFSLVFALFLTTSTLPVHAQLDPQAGFISIDCGVSKDYIDTKTGLKYVTDTTFRETGVTGSISSSFQKATLATQFNTLRSFPDGTRHCYTLRPSTVVSSKYLIRARFFYGDYDGLNIIPTFDLHLGPNKWSTVQFIDAATSYSEEIIVNITSVYTSVCVVNTGLGTPFVSTLELRPMKETNYAPKYGALALLARLDFGSTFTNFTRYKDDLFDRLWKPFDWPQMAYINTSLTVDADNNNFYQPSSKVMSTAVIPRNESAPIQFVVTPEDPTVEYYIYMHFAEIEKLEPNQTREFTIFLNGLLWFTPVQPTYLYTNTLYSANPTSRDTFVFSLERTKNSTLPPLINAIEIYEVNRLFQAPTSQSEVDAMKNIKSTYGFKRNWQGDPCAPQNYTWEGLNCSFSSYDPPKITYLNLSSSGMTGEIPSYISDLEWLQILDLSNNSLNGTVPGFLTKLSALRVLNLATNHLEGSVPPNLIDRHDNGLLLLRDFDIVFGVSVQDNKNLCPKVSCAITNTTTDVNTEKKSANIIIPIVASVAGVTIIIVVFALIIFFIHKRRNQGGKVQTWDYKANEDDILEATKRQVSYAEVQSMTNNFKTVVGVGGFGSVYLGSFNGAPVAVKMLSKSSAQGYKEFLAEVKILLRVHHRNLTPLVAYCDDSDDKALIYEYMVNGNLSAHLSAKSSNVLSWEERMCIAVDSSQGLEYLHYGCKPQIVHRDIKTTNILLNDNFQAKIADFGLSRASPADGASRIMSTVVAGTPGYLDPEYFFSEQLVEKVDVFSFGIVLLEIITGRKVITRNEETSHISEWTKNVLEREGDVRKAVDSRLQGDFDVNSAWKAVEVAMACASPSAAKRPTMTEVVMELNECLSMERARTHTHSINVNISGGPIDIADMNLYTETSPFAR